MARTEYTRDFADQIALSETAIMNYLAKVSVGVGDDCWLWTGATCKNGYGAFSIQGRQYVATHIALVMSGRPRPAAPFNFALHGDCSNPSCVNPAHLRWGTPKENSADCKRLGRLATVVGTQCKSAKLNDDLVRVIRSSPKTGVTLSKELGVSTATVSMVRNRIIWTHVD